MGRALCRRAHARDDRCQQPFDARKAQGSSRRGRGSCRRGNVGCREGFREGELQNPPAQGGGSARAARAFDLRFRVVPEGGGRRRRGHARGARLHCGGHPHESGRNFESLLQGMRRRLRAGDRAHRGCGRLCGGSSGHGCRVGLHRAPQGLERVRPLGCRVRSIPHGARYGLGRSGHLGGKSGAECRQGKPSETLSPKTTSSPSRTTFIATSDSSRQAGTTATSTAAC